MLKFHPVSGKPRLTRHMLHGIVAATSAAMANCVDGSGDISPTDLKRIERADEWARTELALRYAGKKPRRV
jgi:hypothetical protein